MNKTILKREILEKRSEFGQHFELTGGRTIGIFNNKPKFVRNPKNSLLEPIVDIEKEVGNNIFFYEDSFFDKKKNDWIKAEKATSTSVSFAKTINRKSKLTIDKNKISLGDGKICKVYIKIKSTKARNLSINDRVVKVPAKGGFLDITNEFVNSKGKLELDIYPLPERPGIQPILPSGFHDKYFDIKLFPSDDIKLGHEIDKNPFPFPSLGNGIDQIVPLPIESEGDLIVTYLRNDDSVTATETYSMAGGTNGIVYLTSGEMIASFDDLISHTSGLSWKINHTFKRNSTNYLCGKDWRLNLHQTLIKNSSKNAGVDYIYTDENGYEHGFIETYYYFGARNQKVIVARNQVSTDFDGTLFFKVNGEKQKVYKEQRTSSGLTLTNKIEGVKNAEYLEQRTKEQKQIEEYLYSYKNNLKSQVIIDKKTGLQIASLKDYFVNDVLHIENYQSFNEINEKNQDALLIGESDALHYKSLLLQKRQLNDQIGSIRNEQIPSINNSITSVNQSLALLRFQKESILNQDYSLINSLYQVITSYDHYKDKDSKNSAFYEKTYYSQGVSIIKQLIIDSRINYNYYVGSQIKMTRQGVIDKFINYPEFKEAKTIYNEKPKYLYTQYDQLLDQEEYLNNQKKILEAQKKSNETSCDRINEQLNEINGQIDYLVNKNDYRKSEFFRLYKEYINKEYELFIVKDTTPLIYLSNDRHYLCFNESGELCAISDKYQNQLVINHDVIGRISKVKEGDKETIFKYNYFGQLESISGPEGQRTIYHYANGDKLAPLTSVELPNGDILSISYNNSKLIKLESEKEKTKTVLSYTDDKLTRIENYSLVKSVSNNGVQINTSKGLKPVSTTLLKYEDFSCTIETDETIKTFYLDIYGNVTGGYSTFKNGDTSEALSYSYMDRKRNWTYNVQEIDAPFVRSNGNNSITVSKDQLPTGCVEFVFSAIANDWGVIQANHSEFILHKKNQKEETAENFDLSFYPDIIHDGGKPRFELFAQIYYSVADKIMTKEYRSSFDYRITGPQLCALPVTIDNNNRNNVTKIILRVVYEGKSNIMFSNIRFAKAKWTYKKFDEFKNVKEEKNSLNLINESNFGTSYRTIEFNYHYDNALRLIKKVGLTKEISIIHSQNRNIQRNNTESIITKYFYNQNNILIREETFVEGKENQKGVVVTEYIYDESGSLIMESNYNSLDSSSKRISEKEYTKSGVLVKEYDATGLYYTSYEYDREGNISTVIGPSEDKFVYGRDTNTGTETAISKSTEEGIGNSINTTYTCGLVTRLESGKNIIEYIYNSKREQEAVLINGKQSVVYSSEKNIETKKTTILGITFEPVLVDKSIATLKGSNSQEDITTEATTDKKGNLISTTVNGNIQFINKYEDKKLVCSVDAVTGTIFQSNYDEDNRRFISTMRSASIGKENLGIPSVKESYTYDLYGRVSSRTIEIDENCSQKFSFTYEGSADETIKGMSLPNGTTYVPRRDLLNRYCGKELSIGNKVIFGEIIEYRKVGDHMTDMISSIRYGINNKGRYSINEGISYKYDKRGNITEIWERGILSSVFHYDSINRIKREDNRLLGKTFIYSYDSAGNIVLIKETPFTRESEDKIEKFSIINNLAYDGDHLIFFNDLSFDYDSFGNPIIYKDEAMKWTEGRLTEYKGTKFVYDGYGKRVKKNDIIYVYDSANKLIRQFGNNVVVDFIYDENGIVGITYNGVEYLLRKNAQGDITHIYDIDGNLIAHYVYDSWGNHIVVDAQGEVITDKNHVAIINPYRYRGYYFDQECGLYYLVNRYYDPTICRFISRDQIGYLDPKTINGLNLFAYCGNNPVMRIDENGNSWSSFWRKVGNFFKKLGLFLAGVVMAVVGFAIVAVAAVVSLASSIVQLVPNPISSIVSSITGGLTQVGMSLGMYGGFFMAAWDDKIYNDLASINFNMFNNDEDAVINSKKVSFYKGVPVTKQNVDRSYNVFGAIALNSDSDVNTLKHEYGHSFQQLVLGPINYLFTVGIPSAAEFQKDKYENHYYDTPWESIASQKGGAGDIKEGKASGSSQQKFMYLASLCGLWSLFYSGFGSF